MAVHTAASNVRIATGEGRAHPQAAAVRRFSARRDAPLSDIDPRLVAELHRRVLEPPASHKHKLERVVLAKHLVVAKYVDLGSKNKLSQTQTSTLQGTFAEFNTKWLGHVSASQYMAQFVPEIARPWPGARQATKVWRPRRTARYGRLRKSSAL